MSLPQQVNFCLGSTVVQNWLKGGILTTRGTHMQHMQCGLAATLVQTFTDKVRTLAQPGLQHQFVTWLPPSRPARRLAELPAEFLQGFCMGFAEFCVVISSAKFCQDLHVISKLTQDSAP